MFKEKSHHVLLFCSIVTITSAVLQYLYPTFYFFDGGLIAAILLTVFLKHDHYTLLFGAAGVVLVIVASFYHPESVDQHRRLILQHLYSLIIVVLATFFVLYVKKLYRSIESDQQQVKALFDHATEGIILTDEKGKIVLVNPAAFGLFKYDQDELPGQSIDLLIPQRFHHSHVKDREGFYQHPGNRTMGHNRELFARKKDGTEFPVDVSLGYYRQQNKLFVIAFIVDITQRKHNEKELSEIKSRFVSMASHEFRTPLSTILSSATLLSKYTTTEDQDKRDKHIKRTRDAVRHLNVLLEDFLSVGKLEEGKIRPKPAHFALCELLEEVTEEMQSLAKKDQHIHCRCPDGWQITSDKRLVKSILINLLSNAVKFSDEGAPIYLQAERNPAAGFRISVLDKGIGISAEDQQYLFSSFFRGANVINIEGTGLGLHIVRRYLDLLQGKIHLESTLGEGTLVTIELPEQIQ